MSGEEKAALEPLSADTAQQTVIKWPGEGHHLQNGGPPANPTPVELPRRKLGTLVWISAIFFFIFTPFFGSEALQSTIHPVQGLGILNMSILYGAFTFSAAFLASAGVKMLTAKWTLVLAWFFYGIHVAANFYPRIWTLLPAGALSGAMGGLVWVAQGIYLTKLSIEHAKATGSELKPVIGYFNGIFFFCFSTTHIVGNLISSLIFTVFHVSNDNQTAANQTVNNTVEMESKQYLYNISDYKPVMQESLDGRLFSNISLLVTELPHSVYSVHDNSTFLHDKLTCGADFCPIESSLDGRLEVPPQKVVYTIMAAFILCNVIGHIMTCFLPHVKSSSLEEGKEGHLKQILSTVSFTRNHKLLLLLPSLVEVGAFPGIAVSSFTQAFITCSLGSDWVSLVMLCRGTCFAIGCFISGSLLKCLPRPIIFFVTYGFHVSAVLSWLFWSPTSEHVWPFFVIASVEGAASGSIRVQCGALIGICFPDKLREAFAHASIWNGVGLTISFFVGRVLCFYTKSYILLGLVICSAVGYVILEIIIYVQSKKDRQNHNLSVISNPQEQMSLTKDIQI